MHSSVAAASFGHKGQLRCISHAQLRVGIVNISMAWAAMPSIFLINLVYTLLLGEGGVVQDAKSKAQSMNRKTVALGGLDPYYFSLSHEVMSLCISHLEDRRSLGHSLGKIQVSKMAKTCDKRNEAWVFVVAWGRKEKGGQREDMLVEDSG